MYLVLSLGKKKQLYPIYPGILGTIKEGDLVDMACHNCSDRNGSFVRESLPRHRCWKIWKRRNRVRTSSKLQLRQKWHVENKMV